VRLKILCKIVQKNPTLLTPLMISISQSNVFHLSKQGISLPSLFSSISIFFVISFSLCFLEFFFFFQSFFFWFFVLPQFFFILSHFFFCSLLSQSFFFSFSPNRTEFFFYSLSFFPHSDGNHQYNWVGILKRITNMIGLEFESVFLFFS
jgi:hypothetical protein